MVLNLKKIIFKIKKEKKMNSFLLELLPPKQLFQFPGTSQLTHFHF